MQSISSSLSIDNAQDVLMVPFHAAAPAISSDLPDSQDPCTVSPFQAFCNTDTGGDPPISLIDGILPSLAV
jgi:hypothetical protein